MERVAAPAALKYQVIDTSIWLQIRTLILTNFSHGI